MGFNRPSVADPLGERTLVTSGCTAWSDLACAVSALVEKARRWVSAAQREEAAAGVGESSGCGAIAQSETGVVG
jgi:hypothetical protein